jgi:site-specific recombinase XerD
VKYTINDKVALSRAPEGPLAEHLGSFTEWVSEQGYAARSLGQRVHLAACFSSWLGKQGIRLRRISSEHPAQYLRYRTRRVRPTRSDVAALRHLLDFLRLESLIPAAKKPLCRITPVERLLHEYERYLRQERALANATILNYLRFVQSFLSDRCLVNGDVRLGRLRPHDIVSFVERAVTKLSLKRAKLLTTALRSFLQYARYRGGIRLDLAAAVPTVANWSMTSIPRAILPAQVAQLLASIDRHSAIGQRDYAILLLLARLGLRSSEVLLLELDDFDWQAGSFSVRGKGGRRTELPLPNDVGKAITEYLRYGRPVSASRRLFLRGKAPIRGFLGPSAIGSLVRNALRSAGITAPTNGAHQFRHALATQMLRHGASLTEIGEVLGHRRPQTTKIYAKVDQDALRLLALPWPGGVQ